jgi:hypothetical protein
LCKLGLPTEQWMLIKSYVHAAIHLKSTQHLESNQRYSCG